MPMVSLSTPATAPAAAPASLRTVADQVEDRLQRLLDHERARWVQVDPDLRAPVDTLAGLVLGSGKRLRPAFCYWGFVGSGGDARGRRGSSTPAPPSSCSRPSR